MVHGLSTCGSWALEHRLSLCGAQALLLSGMWDLPGSGLEPVSPALAGGFLTTVSPGKPRMTALMRTSLKTKPTQKESRAERWKGPTPLDEPPNEPTLDVVLLEITNVIV